MTKDEVNKAFINRNEGKEKNLIEERKKILKDKEIEKKEKKKQKNAGKNQFNFKKMSHSEDEDSDESNLEAVDEEEEDFEQKIEWEKILNYAENV